MSSALAIAGVTQVLRDMLNDELVNSNIAGVVGQSVTVTTLPPDRVVPGSGAEASQLNVFLRHVTPNQAWRNEGLPSRDDAGRTRLSNPPLALNLHYVVSAYGAEPLHAEILLGYAMQLLHENPAIPRQALRDSLQRTVDPNLLLPPALQSLADSRLADQVEQLRITPEYLSTEEMSRFWTATLAHFRPCAAYQVTVVLIQKEKPTLQPQPVLVRTVGARATLAPSVPTLTQVAPEHSLPVAQLGKAVSLHGYNLAGANPRVLLANDRYRIDQELTPTGSSASKVEFSIPPGSASAYPVGVYRVKLRVQPPDDTQVRVTNEFALTVAPDIVGAPVGLSRNGTTVSFTLKCTPDVRAGQVVKLILGGREYLPASFNAPANSFDFEVPNAPFTVLPVSLSVDGIMSPMINPEAVPPAYSRTIDLS
jgi:hypothetical protein